MKIFLSLCLTLSSFLSFAYEKNESNLNIVNHEIFWPVECLPDRLLTYEFHVLRRTNNVDAIQMNITHAYVEKVADENSQEKFKVVVFGQFYGQACEKRGEDKEFKFYPVSLKDSAGVKFYVASGSPLFDFEMTTTMYSPYHFRAEADLKDFLSRADLQSFLNNQTFEERLYNFKLTRLRTISIISSIYERNGSLIDPKRYRPPFAIFSYEMNIQKPRNVGEKILFIHPPQQ